jgi:tRNA(Ile)-lysidine synthetase-like protein
VNALLDKFNTRLINPKDHLLLAVSGGIDSMVMLHNLYEFSKSFDIKLTVVHLDHNKRSDSNKDMELVVKTCKKMDLPCYTEQLISKDYDNFHDFARKERYDFFVRTAYQVKANKIVLAHNSNDNTETILMRLVRGSSFEGYRGMLDEANYQGITIIRPMLSVSRKEITKYQEENNISYNEDSSNFEDYYTRNRYRHHVLPFLENENPKYLEKFEQFSNYQRKAYDLIEKITDDFIKNNLLKNQNSYSIKTDEFDKQESIIKIEIIKRITNLQTSNSVELTYQNIEDINNLITNPKPHVEIRLDDNLFIFKSYDTITFTNEKPTYTDYEFIINDFSETKLPDGGLVIITKNPNKYYGNIYKLCYNNLDFIFPLVIRNRRSGDKVTTTSGTKKIKDLLIDKKIPLHARNTLPLIINNDQEILWIPTVYKTQTYGEKNIYIIYQEGINNA